MKEKLTLSIDKETKQKAKSYAKEMGYSISQIVEDFLNAITEEDWSPPEESIVAELSGSLPIDDDRPYKEILNEALSEKYRAE